MTTEHTRIITEARIRASWCEKHSENEQKLANRQLQRLYGVVFGGVIVLVFFPYLLHLIDYSFRSDELPTEMMKKAESTSAYFDEFIQVDLADTALRLEAASSKKKQLSDEKEQHDSASKRVPEQLSELLQYSASIFRTMALPPGLRNSLTGKVTRTSDGRFLMPSNRDTKGLEFFESDNGSTWITRTALGNNVNIVGSLTSMLQLENHMYLGAASENIGDKNEGRGLLMIWSEDGKSWHFSRPQTGNGRIDGRIHSLYALPGQSGAVVAIGYERETQDEQGASNRHRETDRNLLVLRSTNGKEWQKMEPFANSDSKKGELSSLVVSNDGKLFAVGTEIVQLKDRSWTSRAPLVLTSRDGISWEPIRPVVNGRRLLGSLYAIIQLRGDKGLLAAGTYQISTEYRQSFPGPPLLLHSLDGESWAPVALDELELHGNIGIIKVLKQMADGTILAGGVQHLRQDILWLEYSRSPLLLRSTDAVSWNAMVANVGGGELGRRQQFLDLTNRPGDISDIIVLNGRALAIVPENSLWESIPDLNRFQSAQWYARSLDGSEDVLFDNSLSNVLTKYAELTERDRELEEGITEQEEALGVLNDRQSKQKTAQKDLGETTQNLEEVIQKADQLREIGLVATRFAILGLLVYLIQILVNLYRYHIQLSKFYQGRAQALFLFSAQDAGSDSLKDQELQTLAKVFSPEDVTFSKSRSTVLHMAPFFRRDKPKSAADVLGD